MPKQILLFGGAFNPPHLGHQIVIEQAFELIPEIDELWLVPCYQHTFQKELAPVEDRLAMCQLLVNEIPHHSVKVSPIEIDEQTTGSTYQTWQILTQNPKYALPDTQYSFLIGSDQLESFTKWQHWQDLLTVMTFYVYPRSGYQTHSPYDRMTLLDSPTQVITNLSSTMIRTRLKQSLSIRHLVPDSIYKYIESHHLLSYPHGLSTTA